MAATVEGRVGSVAGALAFSVSIDAATGAVTLTQYLAVEHPTGGASHDEDSRRAGRRRACGDRHRDRLRRRHRHATVDLGSIIRFEDDGPAIDVTPAHRTGVTLTTGCEDHRRGRQRRRAVANFGGVFAIGSSSGRTDGTASVSPLSLYAWAVGAALRGFDSGALVNLYLIGGTIVGSTRRRTCGGKRRQRRLRRRVAANGVVTLTQYARRSTIGSRRVNDAPFADQLAGLANGR